MGTRRFLRSAAAGLATASAAGWLALAPASAPTQQAPRAAAKPAAGEWLSALGAALGTPEARADAITYSVTRRQFKVGVLLLDSTTDRDGDGVISAAEQGRGPENPDPYVFYIADSRTDIKPQNWELVNPLAPATVTADIFQRWSFPGPNPGRDPANPYAMGQKVTKNMAAYWEVSLNRASDAELLNYDLLFVTHHTILSMSPAEREKLRRVVDAGAVIWVEDCGNMRVNQNAPFFLNSLQFTGTAAGLGIGAAPDQSGPVVFQPTHPLLNSPFRLTFEEVSNLGDKNYGDFHLASHNFATPSPLDNIAAAPDPETLINIVGNNRVKDVNTGLALPYIAAGPFGSGAVVATAGDSGCDINDYAGGVNVGSGGNSGAYSGTNLQTAHTEDLKFVYNLIAWGSSSSTARRNNRRTGAAFAAANAPLFNDFDVQAGAPTLPEFQPGAAPLSRQGVLYVTFQDAGGNGYLSAFDAQPLRDFDGDGNPDDGLPDLLSGVPFDEMWRVPLGAGQPSSPVFATLTTAAGQVEAILATTGNGTVAAVRALPVVGGRISPTNATIGTNNAVTAGAYPLPGAGGPTSGPPPPVVFENKVYVVEPGNAYVRCVSGFDFSTQWISSTYTGAAIQPAGAPALAQTRLTVRGAVADASNQSTTDVMMYVPGVETSGGSQPAARVYPYWLGTRNEVIRDIQADGTGRTRVAAGGEINKYFIAKGLAGTPFINPVVRARVYAAGGGRTAEQNYAAGIPDTSGNYAVTWQDAPSNTAYYSGVVSVTLSGAPVNGRDPNQRVLVAVDYDVVYVPTDATGSPVAANQAPALLSSRIGSRNAAPLSAPGYVPGAPAFDTPAVAPGDLVIFGANQTGQSATQVFGSIFAVNEQEYAPNASQLRWKATLHRGTAQDDGAIQAVDVDGVPVAEAPVLRNRLAFHANWPVIDAADRISVVPFYEPLRNVRVYGSPAVGSDGITHVLAQAQGGLVSSGRNYTVLMAFKTNPEIVLTLPEAFDPGRPVTLTQADLLNYDPATGTAQAAGNITFSGNGQGSNQVVADPSRGKITITSFANGGAQLSATQSFVVRYTPAGGTQERRVVLPPTQAVADLDGAVGQTADPSGGGARQGAGGFSPLLWYTVLPGTPASSPTVNGDSVYFTMATTGGVRMIAVDANPAANDPTVRIGSGEQVFNVTSTQNGQAVTTNHVRQRQLLQNVSGETQAPVGGEGKVVVAAAAGGLRSFADNATLVTESKRIVEVDADGAAVWSVESTVNAGTAGGAPPIYAPDGTPLVADPTGRGVAERRPLSKPQVARRLAGTEYLIADTGNNRVVRIDRGGKATFECASLNDPYKILGAGDPLTLNGPTDVLYYVVPTVNPATGDIVGREDHYIIADAGHNRVIEVATYYDANNQIRNDIPNINPAITGATVRGERIVVWTTRTASNEGRGLRFQNLSRYVERVQVDDDGDGVVDAGDPFQPQPQLVAVVGNATTAGGNSPALTDFTGGSVVTLDYNPLNTVVFGETGLIPARWTAAAGVDPRTAEPRANGSLRVAIGNIWIRNAVGDAGRIKRIVAPTYFERILLSFNGVVQQVFLICDADGVYACTIQPYTGGGANQSRVFAAFWKFEQADYNRMNTAGGPLGSRLNYGATLDPTALPRFSPASAKRLGNGNFLITNSALGPNRLFASGQFAGEVFEVTPQNLAGQLVNAGGLFDLNATATGGVFDDFSAPKLVRLPAAAGGLNAQRMGDRNNTGLTEQPLFSDRQ